MRSYSFITLRFKICRFWGLRTGSYQGGRGRIQSGSTWTGQIGGFGRKRDRNAYSQGSVAQVTRGFQPRGRGDRVRTDGLQCWEGGRMGHHRENCMMIRCHTCGEFGHCMIDCPKRG